MTKHSQRRIPNAEGGEGEGGGRREDTHARTYGHDALSYLRSILRYRKTNIALTGNHRNTNTTAQHTTTHDTTPKE